jgi:hypothetical protein
LAVQIYMNMKNHKLTVALITALISLAVTSANALTDNQLASVKKSLNKAPVAELAATAATLVAKASPADKADMAVQVTRLAVAKNKAAAPTIVAAISKVAPECAPAVAAEAAKIVNDQADMMAAAAAQAAPAQTAKIVQAVVSAVPSASASVPARIASAQRSSGRSAASVSASGGYVVSGSLIDGTSLTEPPDPAPTPQNGFDPARYSEP